MKIHADKRQDRTPHSSDMTQLSPIGPSEKHYQASMVLKMAKEPVEHPTIQRLD
jgi:hypothetical protein